ncbi:MAG TPA: OPT/YSL family transporter, partial [Candidatus Nanopelagicales bacterium]|nr:OPT/YSL family transporter [Candidatus Nanopelagicales bacterium]
MISRDFSIRAVLTGMAIGGALSACNIYSGLKIGWSSNMSITGALLAYAAWQLRSRSAREARPYTILETNLSQTASSSAAAVSSAGLVAAVPALTVLTGLTLPWWQLALWVGSVCFVGIVI